MLIVAPKGKTKRPIFGSTPARFSKLFMVKGSVAALDAVDHSVISPARIRESPLAESTQPYVLLQSVIESVSFRPLAKQDDAKED